MPQIRPITDLRNTNEISDVCHTVNEPIFITKNGYGDMVVMSFQAYEKLQFESEIYFKLKEAELQAKQTNQRFSHKEVFDSIRQAMQQKADGDNV